MNELGIGTKLINSTQLRNKTEMETHVSRHLRVDVDAFNEDHNYILRKFPELIAEMCIKLTTFITPSLF